MIGTLCFVLFCVLVGSAVGWAAVQEKRPPQTARVFLELPEPKEVAKLDLKYFCECYFLDAFFDRDWTDDERKSITALQHMILFGGQAELPVAYGTQKATLLLAAATWAYVYGHRSYITLFFNSDDVAQAEYRWLEVQLQKEGPLRDDFQVQEMDWVVCREMADGLHGVSLVDLKTEKIRRPDLLLFHDPIPQGAIDSERVRKARRIYNRICGHAWHALPPPEKQLALVTLTTRPPLPPPEVLNQDRQLEHLRELKQKLQELRDASPDQAKFVPQ